MLEKIIGVSVTNVHFNTKNLEPGGLFIPIKGEQSDGHTYIEDAINNGAIATLWNSKTAIPSHLSDRIKFIKVEDTLKSFQALANSYREEVNPIVIGITGSNGKTTTKEIVAAALSNNFQIHKNSGNYNNHLGVPLTLLTMPKNTELCIVEMGMNHLGEISELTKIAEPDFAIITNIGESHIGHLGSRKNIAKAKMEIIEGLTHKENILFDGDESLLSELNGYPVNDIHIKNLKQQENKISFNYLENKYELPSFGLHNAKNAAFAIKLGEILSVDNEKIRQGLLKFCNANMRLEYKEKATNSFLLDCYNSSLTSLKSALNTFESIYTPKHKIAILGDIFELGNESTSTHKEIGKIATIYPNFEFWFVGKDMSEAYTIAKDSNAAKYFNNTEALCNFVKKHSTLMASKYFLLKASRGMSLEKVYENFN
ncbi:UDP-N-acetylmuramoyl-tripeptide--D-alanyl-D-alanine ligase [Priestia megaterium]|uniref:UDP-N-acetylmuramoyl-tripeptide--D-alanyl-D- alanine ligase n=1 Tax=Priestia megaterium TaxID=1404 RepID=UPI002E1C2A90|nr:UDP-N-acetylmuramoyl-tripeptide--D-alanyl-D-alanine ligase [Priestia megaterium]